jgi:hypothetical protein
MAPPSSPSPTVRDLVTITTKGARSVEGGAYEAIRTQRRDEGVSIRSWPAVTACIDERSVRRCLCDPVPHARSPSGSVRRWGRIRQWLTEDLSAPRKAAAHRPQGLPPGPAAGRRARLFAPSPMIATLVANLLLALGRRRELRCSCSAQSSLVFSSKAGTAAERLPCSRERRLTVDGERFDLLGCVRPSNLGQRVEGCASSNNGRIRVALQAPPHVRHPLGEAASCSALYRRDLSTANPSFA